MTVTSELLDITRDVARRLTLPPVQHLFVPAGSDPGSGIEGEFGVVVLADGSAGFFFALLGDTLQRLHHQVHHADAGPDQALALAAGIDSDDPAARAVALGTICAVTRHLFRRAGFHPDAARNALGGGDFSPDDHVGMVGLFPSLARRLRAQGIRLTVLELRADKVQHEDRFRVTLDPAQLASCNRILCTASTLINGTLDDVLSHCLGARHVAVIGPSASCFPDPLFRRGVGVVGGAEVTDAPRLLARLDDGLSWGDTVRRYTIDAPRYPGTHALLDGLTAPD